MNLNLKGTPAEIVNSTREDLPQLFKDMGFKVGLEIGTHQGEYTEKLCQSGLQIYTVDPWKGFKGQGGQQRYDEIQETYHQNAIQRLSKYTNCTILRKTSMEALEDFGDGSLDFVYIDGDHNFRHASADILEWSKKVKKGGIISGHDYWNTSPHANNIICHVKSVVDAYTKLFEIENWYITGENKPNSFQIKKSWLWVKV